MFFIFTINIYKKVNFFTEFLKKLRNIFKKHGILDIKEFLKKLRNIFKKHGILDIKEYLKKTEFSKRGIFEKSQLF